MNLSLFVFFVFVYPSRYEREFGFTMPTRAIIVDDIRVRGTGKACTHNPVSLPEATGEPEVDSVSE